MTQARYCQKPECLGWEVREDERFCSWCGTRLLDLAARLLHLQQGQWRPLDPPVLLHGSRPALALELRHPGQTGVVEVAGVRCSAPWLELEKTAEPVRLGPGQVRLLEVVAFHRLEDEDTAAEARLVAEGSGLVAEVALQVMPVPGFEASLERTEVMLARGEEVRIPLQVTLVRGRTTVMEPPSLDEDWAEVEWADEVEFPAVLDSRGQRTLHGFLRIPAERAADLADGTPRRTATLALPCTGREDSPPREVLELRFQGSPELVVDPFRGRARFDWTVVRGASDSEELVLTLHNGFEPNASRAPLAIRRLDVVGTAVEVARGRDLFPLTLEPGDQARLALRLKEDLPADDRRTVTLAFDTNEIHPRAFHLGVVVREPRPFPGWLVVDLGTTNTCAALVDDSRAVRMVDLEDPEASPEGPHTLRSALAYRRLVQAREVRVGWLVWKLYVDLARAAVLNAKRKAGDRQHRYEIVPLEEPEETVQVPVRDVLADLYRHVVRRASRQLAASGRADLALSRLVLSHPSRFATHQIEDLRLAARQALEEHLQGLGVAAPVEDRTLHEPVAAALDFLHEAESHAPVHRDQGSDEATWHVLVYDAGGGTTDLTLVRVHSRRRPVQDGASPGDDRLEAVLADGAGRLHLQQVLEEATRERCAARLAERFPGASLPGESPDRIMAGARKANGFVLRSFAESLMAARPAEALLAGDPEAWSRLPASPQVNRQVNLTFLRDGVLKEHAFAGAEVLPDLQEVRRALLDRVQATPPEAWQYRVRVRVLSAAGHARFGGEEMTAAVRDLLVERVREGLGPGEALPLEPGKVPMAQELAARKNHAVLGVWAEAVKIALSCGQEVDRMPDPEGEDPRVSLWAAGREERRNLRDLITRWPTREEVDERLSADLERTVRLAREMLEHPGVARPECVLLVGQASRWPRVEALMAAEFPESRLVLPREAKACVVRGAALYPRLGPRILTGPGVRVEVEGSGEITTSRLGIQADSWGRPSFLELIPVGVEIPEGGRLGRREGLGLEVGPNEIRVLENCGVDDLVHLADGRPNPDVSTIRTLAFEIPDRVPPAAADDAAVEFHLSPSFRLGVKVLVPGLEPIEFAPIEGTDYGRTY